jgi:uncharacterized protein
MSHVERPLKNNNRISVMLIRLYQLFLSPYMGGDCRFYPSCSCYGKEAFETFSWPKAFFLTFTRLLKCHPLGPRGYDPLPERK